MNHKNVQSALREHINPEKAAFYPYFFKTGPGQYGEGDKFLGITVPQTRAIVKLFRQLPLDETIKLLVSEWHEDRLAALFILDWQFAHADEQVQQQIYDIYISHTMHVNNWDLVDQSAHLIVGPYLDGRPEKMRTLEALAESDLLWERRIAVLATYHYIRSGRADEALDIIDMLITDQHDLIHKATGWMLREIGKRVDRAILTDYLDRRAHEMPRTMLRYAIEHLSPVARKKYMTQK